MTEPRHEPPGETSGSAQRAPERLAAPVLSFDLAQKLEQLSHETSWERGDHNADTLVKEPDFRIVLIAMKAGARLPQHQAAGRIAIQALAGHLRVQLPDQVVDLPTGHLVALEPDMPHSVEALEPAAFLLTVSWPAGRGAREHQP
jgi:quercetin dioxygenase-like cupin family protein